MSSSKWEFFVLDVLLFELKISEFYRKNIWEIANELSSVHLERDQINGNSNLVFVGSKQGVNYSSRVWI
jgi:hypothetical protein